LLNYYEILGLSTKANSLEIKIAFRQLAKLYHPDKNPNGKDHFSKLLKAYETLINPDTKLKYDYKLNYEQTLKQSAGASTSKKYRNIDDQELKRRRYYDEHIKKYEKKKTQTVPEPELKENYNEFKYILFATPLAVILFLLIVNLASNDRTHDALEYNRKHTPYAGTVTTEYSEHKNTFSSFGEEKFDYDSEAKLLVENKSNGKIYMCVFNAKKEFLRLVSLKPFTSFEIVNLPKDRLLLTYCMKNSVSSKGEEGSDLFFKSLEFKYAESINPLTLLPQSNKGFIKISREEFFEYSK
jgi:curved DNA-binding protein CbpA